MRSVNKVIVIGHLATDPEVKDIPSGHKVANFKLATNYEWTDQQGVKKQITDFHRIVAWRKLAEIAGSYLKKGSALYLEGRLSNKSYEDKDGNKKMLTEIIADNFNFIDYRKNKGSEEMNLIEVAAE